MTKLTTRIERAITVSGADMRTVFEPSAELKNMLKNMTYEKVS
ncbi:MAG TPA: hypothetical protein VLQ91_17005 [Draconibacterium sp.]|nr:hypothetical protein [Draconibacterium sp.]